jgi:hypothetical protein
MNVDIVISINVYQLVPFLLNQLKNIESHVKSPYIVILNCNDYMFNELKNTDLPNNVFINPEIINKKRFHGSLFHGIWSNIQYANTICKFNFFIVLSSRTIFYKELISDNLIITSHTICNNVFIDNTNKWNLHLDGWNPPIYPYPYWHWPKFNNTLLGKMLLNNQNKLYGTEHEGLCFSYNVIQNILNFLSKKSEITSDLINTDACVEEFALQTIAMYEIDKNNLEFGFMRLSHGETTVNYDKTAPNKYLCKIEFSSIPF